jgi:hypothetical protein
MVRSGVEVVDVDVEVAVVVVDPRPGAAPAPIPPRARGAECSKWCCDDAGRRAVGVLCKGVPPFVCRRGARTGVLELIALIFYAVSCFDLHRHDERLAAMVKRWMMFGRFVDLHRRDARGRPARTFKRSELVLSIQHFKNGNGSKCAYMQRDSTIGKSVNSSGTHARSYLIGPVERDSTNELRQTPFASLAGADRTSPITVAFGRVRRHRRMLDLEFCAAKRLREMINLEDERYRTIHLTLQQKNNVAGAESRVALAAPPPPSVRQTSTLATPTSSIRIEMQRP